MADSVWIVTKSKRIDGEEAECWNCREETPILQTEILGVIRMPAGTPFDLRKVRNHLIEKHGPRFVGVGFMRDHDINIPPEYLYDADDTPKAQDNPR